MKHYKFIEDICCCPVENCGDDLKFNEIKNSFDCVNCPATYEIKDGIPVLMTSHSKNQVRYWDDEKNAQLYGTKYDNYLKKQGTSWGQYKHKSEIFGVDRLLKSKKIDLKNKILLDLGSGNGRYLSLHPEAKTRIAVDASITLLKFSKKREPDFIHVCADVENLPFKNFICDFSISIRVLQHLRQFDKAFKEMVRVTRPEGHTAIQVYNKLNLKELYKRFRMKYMTWPLKFDRYHSYFELKKVSDAYNSKIIGVSGAGWGIHYYFFPLFFFKLSQNIQKIILKFFFFLENKIGENIFFSKSMEMLTIIGTCKTKKKSNFFKRLKNFFFRKIKIRQIENNQEKFLREEINKDFNKNLHLHLDWLKKAQDMSIDNGISRGYSLIQRDTDKENSLGWQPSYPETSGYIMGSLLEAGTYLSDNDLLNRSRLLSNYLLSISKDYKVKGGHLFKDENYSVFDTAQVIKGLLNFYEFSKKKKYLNRALECSKYLLEQEVIINGKKTGKFKTSSISKSLIYQENDLFNIYITQALIHLFKLTENNEYIDLTKRILDYSLSHQKDNGFFSKNDFNYLDRSLTHNIGYVLEALVDCGIYFKDENILNKAEIAINNIKVDENGFLSSRYREDWSYGNNKSSCLVGNAQIVLTMLKLYKITKDKDLLNKSLKILFFSQKSLKLNESEFSNKGGVYGSFPINGDYQPFEEINWGAKYYVDVYLFLLKNNLS